jgi:hypothetical protein
MLKLSALPLLPLRFPLPLLALPRYSLRHRLLGAALDRPLPTPLWAYRLLGAVLGQHALDHRILQEGGGGREGHVGEEALGQGGGPRCI